MIDESAPAWEDAEDSTRCPPPRPRPPPPIAPGSERAGSQEAAFTGEEIWTPERRFGRVFERLALPGFTRAMRFDLLAALGAADIYPLEADGLHFVEDDATTLAAKRLLVSGDRMLLERRARELADAAGMPIGAFDRGLAVWGAPDRARRPDRRAGPGDRRRPRLAVALAFAPLTAWPRARRACSSGSRRPGDRRHAPAPARPWRLLVLGCLALAGAVAAAGRRSRPTTRGRGSSGAARSRTSIS